VGNCCQGNQAVQKRGFEPVFVGSTQLTESLKYFHRANHYLGGLVAVETVLN
jgi:hypothetical protein